MIKFHNLLQFNNSTKSILFFIFIKSLSSPATAIKLAQAGAMAAMTGESPADA